LLPLLTADAVSSSRWRQQPIGSADAGHGHPGAGMRGSRTAPRCDPRARRYSKV